MLAAPELGPGTFTVHPIVDRAWIKSGLIFCAWTRHYSEFPSVIEVFVQGLLTVCEYDEPVRCYLSDRRDCRTCVDFPAPVRGNLFHDVAEMERWSLLRSLVVQDSLHVEAPVIGTIVMRCRTQRDEAS